MSPRNLLGFNPPKLFLSLLFLGCFSLGNPAFAAGKSCTPIPTPIPADQADTRFWGAELIAEYAAKGEPKRFGTRQEGKKDLVPLSDTEIKNPAKLRAALEWMLGGKFQDTCAPLNPVLKLDPGLTDEQMQAAQITQTADGFFEKPRLLDFVAPAKPAEDNIQVYGLEFDGLVGEKSYAYLMVPRGASDGPRPLVVAHHQTLAACASREQIGACLPDESVTPAYGLGVEFARRGYIVLAGPDMPGYGKMREYPEGNDTSLEYDTVAMREIRRYFPNMSVLLAEQIRTRRAINAVLALQKKGNYIVSNPKELMIYGHSKGGANSLLYAALDTNVATFVANAATGLSYPWRADDVGVDEPDGIRGKTGFIGRWCGWGYMQNVCRFNNVANIPLDSPGLVRLALDKGKSAYLNIIEDDYLPYSTQWNAIEKNGLEDVRIALKVGAHLSYEIVESGYRDPSAANLCGIAEKMPTDKATLRTIRYCQGTSGYANPHGIHFGPYNRFLTAIEQGTFTSGGVIHRSNGALN